MFNHAPEGREIGEQLLDVKQRRKRAMESLLEFRKLATRSGWNASALKTAFRQGLNAKVLAELACLDDQISLDYINDMAIHLDKLLRNCQVYHRAGSPTGAPDFPELMQITLSKLSSTEHETWRRDNSCFYCSYPNHEVASCLLPLTWLREHCPMQ